MTKKEILAALGTALAMAGGLFLYLIPLPTAYAITTTIIGWNVPNGTTLGHGIVVLILPLATAALFAGFPLMFEQRGNVIVTTSLVGMLAGNIFGMMSLSATDPSDISFAFVILSAMFLVLWLWKGGT